MAETEVTVGFMMQVDKLVQLIESPIFIKLRLQLLEPHRYPFLLKSLYGLLMLLPQSSAFACLKYRLDSVSTLGLLNPQPAAASSNLEAKKYSWTSSSSSSKALSKGQIEIIDVKAILTQFREMQLKHSERRKHIFKQHSLRRRQRDEKKRKKKIDINTPAGSSNKNK